MKTINKGDKMIKISTGKHAAFQLKMCQTIADIQLELYTAERGMTYEEDVSSHVNAAKTLINEMRDEYQEYISANHGDADHDNILTILHDAHEGLDEYSFNEQQKDSPPQFEIMQNAKNEIIDAYGCIKEYFNSLESENSQEKEH